MSAKRFRVAFSFAGEKRDYVAQVAAILAKQFGEPAVLYDKYHEAEFARARLGRYLPKLYHEQSDLVVVVICTDYPKKEWCGLEWDAIFDLLKKRREDEVMLANFDYASVDGLYSDAGFINLDRKTPDQAAALILERLAINEGKPKDHYTKPAAPDVSIPPHTTVPHNLPRLHSFVGRGDELKTIADALSPQTRTWGALIDGPGGIGKTSLAVRAAELAPPGQFDRILFLSSKQRRMTAEGQRERSDFVVPGYLEMLNEIARLLERPELTKEPEDVRARVVIGALEPARALLILDNLESLPKDQQNRLFEFLSQLPPSCKAIATSRRRSDVDARIVRLGKLDQDAALALIAELAVDRPLLAKAADADRVHLYEETGGNPLLLRWIAGQLGRGRCRTLASALELCRNAADENDPLEFIFGDLLETFTEAETKALVALSYFTQLVAVKHIAEIAGITNVAAQTALDDLANRALVLPDEENERFALVPMVADFLRRRKPEVVAETGDRLDKRAYALVVENGYGKHDRFPALDAAWPTVAAALPQFLAGPNDRLQTVCSALQLFLEFTGRWDEQLALSRAAEARAMAARDFSKAGWRAYDAGRVHKLRGESAEVLDCASRAEAHWRDAGAGTRERAVAIRLRGCGHQLAKDYPTAIAAHRESVDLDRAMNPESKEVAIGLIDLAETEQLAGDLPAAERNCREALRIAKAVDYREGIAICTGNLAGLALDCEDWPGAEAVAREALALSEKVGRQELIALDHNRLAKALARQGRKPEALPHARRAVDIFTALHSPELEVARRTLTECEG